MRKIALGIGTNLGSRLQNLRNARDMLIRRGLIIEKCSDVFETEPWGVKDQPKYLNACMTAKCDMKPTELLGMVKEIEAEMGREYNYRWGPRIIDIDILLIEGVVIESEQLNVPHIRMTERDFVLHPLAQIAPKWRHPNGRNIEEMASEFHRPLRITDL